MYSLPARIGNTCAMTSASISILTRDKYIRIIALRAEIIRVINYISSVCKYMVCVKSGWFWCKYVFGS